MESKIKKQGRIKMDLLTAVENIVDLAKDSKLSPEFYRNADKYIKYIGKKLGLTKEQSVLMAMFIENSNDQYIEVRDFSRFTGCRSTQMIRYINDLDELVRHNLIIRSRSSKSVTYRVPPDVIVAFKDNATYTPKDYSGMNCYDLFVEFSDIVDRVEDDEMDNDEAVKRFRMLIEGNKQLLFSQKILSLGLESNEFALLIMFCHLFVNDNDDMVCFLNIDSMFCKRDMRHIRTLMEHGDHKLQQLNLIEWSNSDGMGDKEHYRLTMNAKCDLLDELQLPTLEGNQVSRNMIRVADIKPRSLFYSNEVTNSIDDLARLLEDKNYNDIRTRLQEQGFRCGFTCLFYGAPGTGKTETVMQLARHTGRDIMQVNISEMKSKWVVSRLFSILIDSV